MIMPLKKAHLLRCARLAFLWLIAYGSYGQSYSHKLSAICEVGAPRIWDLFDRHDREFFKTLAEI